jgi:hypothetical protein
MVKDNPAAYFILLILNLYGISRANSHTPDCRALPSMKVPGKMMAVEEKTNWRRILEWRVFQ